jgi:hypothetical protein
MTEQVGGETTTHYRATGQLLGGLIAKENPGDQVISGQADFWISNTGDYIKQYLLDAVVQDNEDRKLHESGSLFVSGAGSLAQISTPAPQDIAGADLFDQPAQQAPEQTVVPGGGRTSEAGEAALKALPTPPQARSLANADVPTAVRAVLPTYQVASVPSDLYTSYAKAADIAASYEIAARQQGWNEVMGQTGSSLEQPTLLMFNKGSLDLLIAVLPDTSKGRNVVLVQVQG